MNKRKQAAMIAVIASASLQANAQGIFQNLDFESANLSPIPAGQFGGPVSISAALPGWSASLGSIPVIQVLQNNNTLGAAGIDILGPHFSFNNPGIIGGNYTVFIQSGEAPDENGTVSASLWQSGTIPANAESLQFKAWNTLGSDPLLVSFAGNSLSPVLLSTGQAASGQSYDVFGANIGVYAGQTGQLEFTAQFANWTELDDISFSPTAVPEPSTLALVVMGGMSFGVREWRKRGKAKNH